VVACVSEFVNCQTSQCSVLITNVTRPTEVYTRSLHDALPISSRLEDTTAEAWDRMMDINAKGVFLGTKAAVPEEDALGVDVHHRSEEHTSELQSRFDLVCRLLLEKKNTTVVPHLARVRTLIN